MRETLEGWGRMVENEKYGNKCEWTRVQKCRNEIKRNSREFEPAFNRHRSFPLDGNRKPRFFDSKHSAYFNKIYIYIYRSVVLFHTGKYADKLKAVI